VILIGTAADRARSRRALAGTSIEIVAEFATPAAARAARLEADAFVVSAGMDDDLPAIHAVDRDDEDPLVEPLTPREIDVVGLLAEGLSNRLIATRLAISDQTVKFHVASICGKLGAANRTDAVRLAIKRGLVAL
jgi:ATP/maltotriose-dependent transcriptional regulator MalT